MMERRTLLALPAALGGAMNNPRALTFDVFGTVVDWRGSIIAEGQDLNRKKRWNIDWELFAGSWRAGYAPAMDRVRKGDLPWQSIDSLHRLILDGLLEQFNVPPMTEAEINHLNRVWHRLKPWPDAVEGLARLKKKYVIASLSNGNVSLLVDLARHGGYTWDAVLSAELFHHYKPDPEAYLGAARLLDAAPRECLMVAAHLEDLKAAARSGLRTAYVSRPLEYGPNGKKPEVPKGDFDWVASDFLDLAAQLGA